ncbi:MAG: hypothetical protein WA728_09380, partial [Xanthobacteraceae bacterium]
LIQLQLHALGQLCGASSPYGLHSKRPSPNPDYVPGFGVPYYGGGRLNPYWSEIFVRRGFWITDDKLISM